MATANLVTALALIALAWLAVSRALARSCAETPPTIADGPTRTRRYPDNRLLPALPEPTGPINSSSTVAVGRRKDLA